MTDRDRERALRKGRLLEDFCGILNDCQRELLAERVADVMLEFAANEVETCVGDPTFRAEELRAQIGGKR